MELTIMEVNRFIADIKAECGSHINCRRCPLKGKNGCAFHDSVIYWRQCELPEDEREELILDKCSGDDEWRLVTDHGYEACRFKIMDDVHVKRYSKEEKSVGFLDGITYRKGKAVLMLKTYLGAWEDIEVKDIESMEVVHD